MSIDTQMLNRGFLLAGWQVEPLKGQIKSSDGSRRHVTPKAMGVLVLLASRLGETVMRQTILKEVWGSASASDEALTHCVSELRHAFDDHPDRPEYFQTIRKRGYRLIAEVKLPSQTKAENESGFVATQVRDLRKRKVFQIVFGYPVLGWLLVQIFDVLWEYLLAPLGAPAWIASTLVVLLALGYPVAIFLAWAVDLTPGGVKLTLAEGDEPKLTGLVFIGVGSVAVTVLALFLYFRAQDEVVPQTVQIPETETRISPVEKSVAVLRILNIGDNPALQYLSDGLTEEIIHELTNLGSIKVPARTSIWSLSTSDLQATEIAAQLRVEKLLEASVRMDGDDIRVTAQLIDEDGFHLWSQAYDESLADPLGVQKEIATRIVADLEVVLDDDKQERLSRRPTEVSGAYDQYLRGRQYLREPSDPANLESAGTHFRAAIELDNRFPLAYAGLCETHLANYRLTRSTEHFANAEIACHRALTLDGGLAEVYTSLGNLYRHSGQYDKAQEEYQTALTINPIMEEATFGLGRVYQGQGRLVEAEETLLRTIELEPSYWGTYFGVANFLFRQGRYAEAVPHYTKVTELAPEYAGAYINLGSSLLNLGDWETAETAYRKSIELHADSMAYQNLGTLFYYSHDFDKAAEMHRKAIEISPSDHRAWGKLAAAERYVPGSESSSASAYAKAIALVESRLAINPDESEDLMFLGSYQINSNRSDEALLNIEKALSLTPESPYGHYYAAIVHNRLGNVQKALSELEIAANLGYSLKIIASDPQFENLADHEDFWALTKDERHTRRAPARDTGV